MADPNALYSYNGLEPTILPHRITLSDGTSRTDITTFTDEQINDAGFTGPYEKPEYNYTTQKLVWSSETFSYSIVDLPPSEPTEEDLWFEMRRRRNFLLFESDWTQSRDIVLPNDDNWKTYRQELRDLPENIDDIKNISWPVSPADTE